MNNYRHGKCCPREYASWTSMKTRCTNKTRKNYLDYGGRGITYCYEWESFKNFYEDMGERPEGMSLDRIGNDGDYELSNCR